MEITEKYSHKNGEDFIKENHPNELEDIYSAVNNIDLKESISKISYEKTKEPLLFSPTNLNDQLKKFLFLRGWTKENKYSKKGFTEPRLYWHENKFVQKETTKEKVGNEFREMDGIKNKVGLEIQFGKYSFMGYDIFSKMPIFSNAGLINCGIELVVMPSMVKNMSTGVSSFNQITQDMIGRGEADIDLPTLILGFECNKDEWKEVTKIREDFSKAIDQLIIDEKIHSIKTLANLSKNKREPLLSYINQNFNLKIDGGFKGSLPGPK